MLSDEEVEKLYLTLTELGELMDKLKVPWCLTASTLLGIYRDNRPTGGISEIDYMAEYMTKAKMKKIEKLDKYKGYSAGEQDLSKQTIWYFESNGIKLEVQAVYFVGDIAYKNLVDHKTLIWPKEVYGKFKTKEWHGREWPIPENTPKWLETYYGNWQVPNDFNWSQAGNCRTLGEVLQIHDFNKLMNP